MNKLTAEQTCLLGLSRTVWHRRKTAKANNLPYNEPTITEDLLLDLAMTYPGTVEIFAFSPTEEGDFGADWIWSFVNASETSSLTMLVQAKKLDRREQRYTGLNQIVGDRQPPERQADVLLATAARHNVPAMYAFYNHLSDDRRVPRRCQSLMHADADQIYGFGIAMAEAQAVHAVLPDDTFSTHSVHSLHFHCLLCSGGSGNKGAGGSPELIVAAMREWRRRKRGIDADPPEDGDRLGFVQGPHPLVKLARDAQQGAADDMGLRRLGEELGVAGLIVFKDSEDPTPSERQPYFDKGQDDS